jgi:arsenate reductase (glutaredoxin)
MQDIVIYHNPRCSKSRQALALLQERGVEPVIVEYLKTPLTFDALEKLSQHFEFTDFVRCNELEYKDLKLSVDDKLSLLKAMETHPKLMQRPIVVRGKKAVIGRPPENVLELL